jgi:hypothetical protein
LDDKATYIILGYDTRDSNYSLTPSNGVSKTNLLPQQKIYLHDMSAYDLLQVYAPQVNHATSEIEELGDADDNTTETPSNTPSDDADTRPIHAATSSGNNNLPPGDICCVILKASKIFVNKCEYLVSKHDHTSNMSLVAVVPMVVLLVMMFVFYLKPSVLWISKVLIIISSPMFLLEPLVVMCQHKKVMILPLCISMHFLVKVHPSTHHVN